MKHNETLLLQSKELSMDYGIFTIMYHINYGINKNTLEKRKSRLKETPK